MGVDLVRVDLEGRHRHAHTSWYSSEILQVHASEAGLMNLPGGRLTNTWRLAHTSWYSSDYLQVHATEKHIPMSSEG